MSNETSATNMTKTLKWVSPTGRTLVYQHDDGSTTYEFPDTPHKQLPYTDTSNKGKYGLKSAATKAKESQ